MQTHRYKSVLQKLSSEVFPINQIVLKTWRGEEMFSYLKSFIKVSCSTHFCLIFFVSFNIDAGDPFQVLKTTTKLAVQIALTGSTTDFLSIYIFVIALVSFYFMFFCENTQTSHSLALGYHKEGQQELMQ